MTDFAALLACLHEAEVDFLIIGGVAAVAHGSARLTQDLETIAELEALLEERA
jgi:hypothetical protein